MPVLVLYLSACSEPVTLPTEGEFSALSYNVHGLPPTITGDDTAGRMALIAPLLPGFDVIGLQEDFDDDNHATLEASSEHPTRIRFAELLEDERFYGPGLAVFAQPDAVHTHHEHYEDCSGVLEGASDCLASKGFQVIRLQLGPEEGHTLDLYNTHMEAGGGEGDIAARAGHLDQLLVAMSGVSAGRAVLFLGDTNLHGGDPAELAEVERLLEGAGLTELCVAVDCPEPERIDRILYRSSDAMEITGLDWWVAEGFEDADSVPLSDHDPIAGRIGWASTSED